MATVTLAATQFACSWDIPDNIAKAKAIVQAAAAKGANVVLLPELFATPYFCQDQSADYFVWRTPSKATLSSPNSPILAKELSGRPSAQLLRARP